MLCKNYCVKENGTSCKRNSVFLVQNAVLFPCQSETESW